MTPRRWHLAALTLCWPAALCAQTIDAHVFHPEQNGPWQAVVVGNTAPDTMALPGAMTLGETIDGTRLDVTADGAVYLMGRMPLGLPATGGAVVRLRGLTPERLGDDVGHEPGELVTHDGALHLAGRGTARNRAGAVLAWRDGAFVDVITDGPRPEITTLASAGDALLVGTRRDGVYRLADGVLTRVGVRVRRTEGGFRWDVTGDYTGGMDHSALMPDGTVVATTKDLRARHFDGRIWTDLGDVAERTVDADGNATGLREPKGIGVCGGRIYVGTKGAATSPEGRNAGRVWRYDDGAWTRLGDPPMPSEVNFVFCLDDGLLATTKSHGVWRYADDAWTRWDDGLPRDDAGQVGGEATWVDARARPETVYVGVGSVVYRRRIGADAFEEAVRLPGGEGILSLTMSPDGTLYIGTSAGESGGALFRVGPDGAAQVGEDTATEVKAVYAPEDDHPIIVLTSGEGTFRWDGAAFASIMGNLVALGTEIKYLTIAAPDDLYAITRNGLFHGVYAAEPTETLESPALGPELLDLAVIGGDVYAIPTLGDILRLGADDDPDSVDGMGFTPAAEGLPATDINAVQVFDDGADILVAQSNLLYRGQRDSDGTLRFEAFGQNPGAAALDGDGELVFTGETTVLDATRAPDGRIWLATADGLFVDDGAGGWSLVNGPAEVRAVRVVGHVVFALVNEQIFTDPVAHPELFVTRSVLWLHDLDPDAPAPDMGVDVPDVGPDDAGVDPDATPGGDRDATPGGDLDGAPPDLDPGLGDAANDPEPSEDDDDGGCDCRADDGGGAAALPWLLVALGLTRRRRRR